MVSVPFPLYNPSTFPARTLFKSIHSIAFQFLQFESIGVASFLPECLNRFRS
jgi:hypothetical protein